jgi:hypothetical protein
MRVAIGLAARGDLFVTPAANRARPEFARLGMPLTLLDEALQDGARARRHCGRLRGALLILC